MEIDHPVFIEIFDLMLFMILFLQLYNLLSREQVET